MQHPSRRYKTNKEASVILSPSHIISLGNILVQMYSVSSFGGRGEDHHQCWIHPKVNDPQKVVNILALVLKMVIKWGWASSLKLLKFDTIPQMMADVLGSKNLKHSLKSSKTIIIGKITIIVSQWAISNAKGIKVLHTSINFKCFPSWWFINKLPCLDMGALSEGLIRCFQL